MDNKQPFFIAPYPHRPATPWKMEIRAAVFGKKIRRFCASEAEAWQVGNALVQELRERGTQGSREDAGLSMRGALVGFRAKYARHSKSHRDKVEAMAAMLEKAFPLVNVAPAELVKWFADIKGSETYRAGFYRYARLFFRWARKMQYIERDPSEVLDAPRAAVGRNILSVEQMRELISAPMEGWLLATMLLGGFAGLRTEEMVRMNWEDIDTKAGEILIRPGVGKITGGVLERIVEFTDPLRRRKKLLHGRGRLLPVTRREFDFARAYVVKSLGWEKWPANCLRHSFATYHLAVCRNAGKTAYEMGHTSPSMVQRVYAVPARRADGAAWWRL